MEMGKTAIPKGGGITVDIYVKAWKLLLERIEKKTGWGKNELKQLMIECLLDAGKEV